MSPPVPGSAPTTAPMRELFRVRGIKRTVFFQLGMILSTFCLTGVVVRSRSWMRASDMPNRPIITTT